MTNERIKKALKRGDMAKIAEILNMSHQNVTQKISSDKEIDSVEFINAVSQVTGLPFEHFVPIFKKPDFSAEMSMVREEAVKYGYEQKMKELQKKGPKVLAVSVDRTGNENIVYVPIKAHAGYMVGFADPSFISSLPAYSMPGFVNGSFRMFQVQGDSMYQFGGAGLYNGDIVIAQYVEDPYHIRDNRVYVIVSQEGVIIKRCINRFRTEEQVLVCNSDNKNGEFPPIILALDQVKEVWEFKARISRQIPQNLDYYESLMDLQARVTLLEEKLKKK